MSGETQMRTALTAIGLAGLLMSACTVTGLPDVRVRGIPTPRTPAVVGVAATASATAAATVSPAPTATIVPPATVPAPATVPPVVVEGGIVVPPAPAIPPPYPMPPVPCGQRVTHVVHPQETLYSIAVDHVTTVAEIMRINRIRDPRAVAVGRRLVIVACGVSAPRPPHPRPQPSHRYVVRAGDNLFRIGLRFGVSVAALRAANGLRGNDIHVGQVLVIP